MTDLQVLSRCLVYGAGWLGTALGIIALSCRKGDLDPADVVGFGFVLSATIWALIVGIIYW